MAALRIAPLRVASAVSAIDACSFCGRREHEASVMLRGVIAWACDTCIDDLAALLADRRASRVHVHVRCAREESDPTSTNPPSPSNRDVSADDKPSSAAAPQGEAALAGTGSEMLAGREGRSEGEASGSPAVSPPASADQATTDARPGFSPRARDTGLPENGRNDPLASTAGITGERASVESGPCVATSGAGEGVVASRDPAPASDRVERKDPLRDPAHVVTPYFKSLICAEYGIEADSFEDFRAGLIEGLSHTDAAARVSALAEA